jgi:hypothetical protein
MRLRTMMSELVVLNPRLIKRTPPDGAFLAACMDKMILTHFLLSAMSTTTIQ